MRLRKLPITIRMELWVIQLTDGEGDSVLGDDSESVDVYRGMQSTVYMPHANGVSSEICHPLIKN